MSQQVKLPASAPVVVVGGGYAGLAAALTLHDHGMDAVVLEGADRVGGRVLSQRSATGTVLDHGGQWVGPTQEQLLAWAARFDCPTFPTWENGKHLELWHDGALRTYTGEAPDAAPGLEEYRAATARIDELASQIDLVDPARSSGAPAWDGETVESYLERTVADADARRRLDLAVQGVWSMEPREISVLHLLFYVASAGGYHQLMDTGGAAQDARFVAGAQAPALAAARTLADSVMCGVRVDAIEQQANGLVVSTSAGPIRAGRVVMATPPPATARIRFRPGLPTTRARWLQRSVMGDVAKVHALYAQPFWRDVGLSGVATVYGSDHAGVVFDNSPPDANSGALVAFIYGDRYREWSRLPASQRRACILSTLEKLYGAAAREPVEYVEKLWPEDDWVGGGYAANPTPGAWLAHGTTGWRRPCGRIHWAGAETASRWNGYIDGAISSGNRAAYEALEASR